MKQLYECKQDIFYCGDGILQSSFEVAINKRYFNQKGEQNPGNIITEECDPAIQQERTDENGTQRKCNYECMIEEVVCGDGVIDFEG